MYRSSSHTQQFTISIFNKKTVPSHSRWGLYLLPPPSPLIYATDLQTFLCLFCALITAISVCWTLYCVVFVNSTETEYGPLSQYL